MRGRLSFSPPNPYIMKQAHKENGYETQRIRFCVVPGIFGDGAGT